MTDTLTKAKDLLERFVQRSEPEGHEETDKLVIPEMKWEGIWKPKAQGVIVIRSGTRMIEPWTDARLGLAVRSPEMLTLLKELVGMIEKERHQTLLIVVAEQEENQALKQRLAELEGKG